MSYPIELREKAFQQYKNGTAAYTIARNLKINQQTICNWRKKYKWEQRRQKIIEKTQKKLDEKTAERDARQLKIIEATYARYLQQLRDGQINPTAGEIKRLMEQERLIAGESTERIEILRKRYEKWFTEKPVEIKTQDATTGDKGK